MRPSKFQNMKITFLKLSMLKILEVFIFRSCFFKQNYFPTYMRKVRVAKNVDNLIKTTYQIETVNRVSKILAKLQN